MTVYLAIVGIGILGWFIPEMLIHLGSKATVPLAMNIWMFIAFVLIAIHYVK